MPLSFNGRLARVEQRVQTLVYGEDLTPTPEELAEEQGFRHRVQAFENQWRYVQARHARSDFLRTMGAIPPDWPCSAVHPDPQIDWQTIPEGESAGAHFWKNVGSELREHKRIAEALGVPPAELPLWTDEAYWQQYHAELEAELAEQAAAGDTEAQEWLEVVRGERLHPDILEARESYRQELAARFEVPLAEVPAEAMPYLWRYPHSRKELLRGVQAWRQQQAGS